MGLKREGNIRVRPDRCDLGPVYDLQAGPVFAREGMWALLNLKICDVGIVHTSHIPSFRHSDEADLQQLGGAGGLHGVLHVGGDA